MDISETTSNFQNFQKKFPPHKQTLSQKNSPQSYYGSMNLTCDNGVVSVNPPNMSALAEDAGYCWENCRRLSITNGPLTVMIENLQHNTSTVQDCSPVGPEFGYLKILCYDGKLSRLDGSCAGSVL